MRARLPINARFWLVALAGVAALGWAGLYGFAWNDYDAEASGAFRALMDGHIGRFLTLAPSYGGSLVLRAPFAWLTGQLGGGELAVYRSGSIACLAVAAAGGTALVARMGVARGTGARMLVLLLFVANPLALMALELGHPEEILTGVLCVAAVLAAAEGRRPTLAAVLLGLAIASKPWAVLAIGPVLLALPDRRLRALVIAGGVTAAVLAPLLLAGSQTAVVAGASKTGGIFQPWQIFWPLGKAGALVIGGDGLPKPGFRGAPLWLSPYTHPLIVLLGIPLSLLWARRHPRASRSPEQVLLLLALLLSLRCLLDPWNNAYYALPFFLALLAWEAVCHSERPPVLSLLVVVGHWVTFKYVAVHATPDVQWALYVLLAVPLTGWMAWRSLGPVRARAAVADPSSQVAAARSRRVAAHLS